MPDRVAGRQETSHGVEDGRSESERKTTAPTFMRVLSGRARCDARSLCRLVVDAALAGSWADATLHTCFTDRADEHHIEGEWTTKGTYNAPYDECTDQLLRHPKNSQCNLPTLQAAAGGVNVLKRFHATSCELPPFDATGFARVIGHGATLWFLGDSIMDQQMESLLCLMRAGGFTIDGGHYGPVKCKIMTDTKGSKRSFRICRAKQFSSSNMLPMLLRLNHNAHLTAHQETVLSTGSGANVDYMDMQVNQNARFGIYTSIFDKRLDKKYADIKVVRYPAWSSALSDACKLGIVNSQMARAHDLCSRPRDFSYSTAVVIHRMIIGNGYDEHAVYKRMRSFLSRRSNGGSLYSGMSNRRLEERIHAFFGHLRTGRITPGPNGMVVHRGVIEGR